MLDRKLSTQEVEGQMAKIRQESQKLRRPLTPDEACTLVGISKDLLRARAQRHSGLRKYVKWKKQRTAADVDAYIAQLRAAVQEIRREKQSAPSREVVIEKLGLKMSPRSFGENLRKLRKTKGSTAGDDQVLLPDELRKTIYRSVGDFFFAHDIPFTDATLAEILLTRPGDVRRYLQTTKNHDVLEYLEARGLTVNWNDEESD